MLILELVMSGGGISGTPWDASTSWPFLEELPCKCVGMNGLHGGYGIEAYRVIQEPLGACLGLLEVIGGSCIRNCGIPNS